MKIPKSFARALNVMLQSRVRNRALFFLSTCPISLSLVSTIQPPVEPGQFFPIGFVMALEPTCFGAPLNLIRAYWSAATLALASFAFGLISPASIKSFSEWKEGPEGIAAANSARRETKDIVHAELDRILKAAWGETTIEFGPVGGAVLVVVVSLFAISTYLALLLLYKQLSRLLEAANPITVLWG